MASADALVRQARAAAGLTQAQLAERVGTTQSAIARLERPGANPRLDTLDRVMTATSQRLELAPTPTASSIDESQILERLRLTPAERLQAFERSYTNMQQLLRNARWDDGRPAPSSVDETLIARQLRMTPAERVKSFEVFNADLRRFADAARSARHRRR